MNRFITYMYMQTLGAEKNEIWHFMALTYDGANKTLYLNPKEEILSYPITGVSALNAGTGFTHEPKENGELDEVSDMTYVFMLAVVDTNHWQIASAWIFSGSRPYY